MTPQIRLAPLALCLICALSAHAQGFNTFNGRNHPELDWQVAETEHFRIMYPARLAGIDAEAAPIAETTYDVLSDNLGVQFDEKIRIYLSDEDEIGNGFAVPIGVGYTAIWVRHTAIATSWTGRAKWLRKVIAHELTHIFHYEATRSNLGLLGNFFGNPTPRFWTEGLAQYETERWDAFRGDRWLRTAVLDDALSYRDGRSIWNGRLMYAAGNAQARYFAAQYGDSTLAQLLAHRKDVLFGLGKVHDFDTAFKETMGFSHRRFYDRWRQYVNVYYNTLAGQLETLDSLDVDPTGSDSVLSGSDPLSLPGRYLYDVQYSPDTSKVAVLSILSPARPVQRLYVVDLESGRSHVVAEGAIHPSIAWHPDGTQLAFARRARGWNGSLLNDLFLVDADGSDLQRLTHSRRAQSPTFSPDGKRLAFIGAKGGTANLFTLDRATGQETQHTAFTGDVQLAYARWHPAADTIALARFTADGTRDLVLFDLSSTTLTPITDGRHDDRRPVWSPDGTQLAYTSFRDDVPNVFAYDLSTGTHRRVTQLAIGAVAHDWRPPDSTHTAGQLALISTVSKRRDQAYLIDARRTTATVTPHLPSPYINWVTHTPPRSIPLHITPDSSLITRRSAYHSWSNLTHTASFALPYYLGSGDAGLLGFTSWLEPLGKHLLFAAGTISVTDLSNSTVLASYANNQWYPTLTLNAYRLPGSARIYSDDLLVEEVTGGDLSMQWPLNWRPAPYLHTTLGARLRYVDLEPLNPEDFESTVDALPSPAAGQQVDVRLSLTRKKLRPYRHNLIHPLDGWGARLQVTGAAQILGGDSEFLRGDLAAYRVLPSLGQQRIFLYGRVQTQTGTSFPQDVLGFTRYDDIQLNLPGQIPLSLGDAERVRGYRSYALGNRVLFGSVEYRVPLLPSLHTRVLGVLSFGNTTLAAFADGGLVWSGANVDQAVQRAGVGLELKNVLRLGGVLDLAHAVGIAQPAEDLGTTDRYGVYYRIQTALPF